MLSFPTLESIVILFQILRNLNLKMGSAIKPTPQEGYCIFKESVRQKQHSNKERCNNPGTALDLLEVTAEDTDNDIGNQTKSDAVGNIIGKGHDRQRKECRNANLEIGPIHMQRV